MRRPGWNVLVPLVIALGAVFVAVITYTVITAVNTKIDVRDIKQPNVKEDQRISDRRIGRLTPEQLVRLGRMIRRAERDDRRAKAKAGTARVPDDLAVPRVRGVSAPGRSSTPAATGPSATATPRPPRPARPRVVIRVPTPRATAAPTPTEPPEPARTPAATAGLDVPIVPAGSART